MSGGSEPLYWLALLRLRGMDPKRFHQLLALATPGELLKGHPDLLAQVFRKPPGPEEIQEALRQAEQDLRRAEQRGTHILLHGHAGYPPQLAPLEAAPPVLFVEGDPAVLAELAIGIVGSRRATAYGKRMAFKLAHDLAAAGTVIVSGGAYGVDTAAHKGALEAGGRTVAVLGSGLDQPYPAANRRLFDRIRSQGAVVSEFPFGTKPFRPNFPIRNRIISGLSRAVVVVEAAERSGALITAQWALDQGREVMAVPGPADSALSAGPHRLIRQGAALVTDAAEVLEELGVAPETAARGRPELPTLSEEERRVFQALGARPVSLDALAEELGVAPMHLMTHLLALEMKGLIEKHPGNAYARNPVYTQEESA